LVLSGAFEQAFRSEGIEFDVRAGAFRMRQETVIPIQLIGAGLRAEWTRRALERGGFAVVDDTESWQVEVTAGGWQLSNGQAVIAFNEIYELMRYLASLLPTDA